MTLNVNSGGNLILAADGSFSFPTPIASGGNYSVTVAAQPTNPSQTCTVTNGSGSISAGNVRNVAVTCATNTYSVGGFVSGLAGSGLTLGINGAGNLALMNNGAFVFTSQIESGASYTATVVSQPTSPGQTCSLTNAAGMVGASSVTNITVVCTTNTYVVGGTVSGLIGSGVDLQINNGSDLPIAANGPFMFTSQIASG